MAQCLTASHGKSGAWPSKQNNAALAAFAGKRWVEEVRQRSKHGNPFAFLPPPENRDQLNSDRRSFRESKQALGRGSVGLCEKGTPKRSGYLLLPTITPKRGALKQKTAGLLPGGVHLAPLLESQLWVAVLNLLLLPTRHLDSISASDDQDRRQKRRGQHPPQLLAAWNPSGKTRTRLVASPPSLGKGGGL